MQNAIQQSQLMHQMLSLMPQYCDKCGFKHNKADLEIVNSDSEKIVCKLECPNCKNMYLFHVNSPMEGILSTRRASIKSDISGDEIKKFSNSEEIIDEEVLDVFIQLKDVKDIKDFNKVIEAQKISF